MHMIISTNKQGWLLICLSELTKRPPSHKFNMTQIQHYKW